MPTEARETSGTMTALIVQYVRRVGGELAVDRVVAGSGVRKTVEQLEDERGWSTYEDKVALWKAAAEVLDDPVVSRHIGEHVLDTRVGIPLRLLLRGFGSPRMVLSNVAKVSPKFSTCATMQAIEQGRRHIVVSYRLHEGKEPHFLDCQANIGLMSASGPLFGLPLLDVEHPECQVEGAPQCVYVVRWPIRRRLRFLRRKRDHLEEQAASLAAQVQSLQSIAADLVSSRDTHEVLDRIVAHATNSVSAQRYLLAVRTRDGAPVQVHQDGFSASTAQRIGEALLADGAEDAPADGGDDKHIVIDVVSARRHYGRLAAYYDEHSFFDHERRLLATYARSAATALDAAAALEEARERGETATALLEMARRLAVLSAPDQVARELAEAMCPVLGAPASTVFLHDPARGGLAMRAAHGLEPFQHSFLSNLVLVRDRLDEGSVAWLDRPEPSFTTPATAETGVGRAVIAGMRVGGLATVPIRRHDELLGLASVFYDDESQVGDVERMLERMAAIADQAATAIENAQLLERARHQATHDELTALPNRVLFEDAARRALASSERTCEPVALLFVDLDGFKAVNDDWGHDAGDAVLTETARRLGTCLRAGDVVARLGGDEFTVLLPATGVDVAREVAERVRDVLGQPFTVAAGALRISACVGVAVAPSDASEYKQLLRAADSAMYAAKRDGRDRCAVYDLDAA
jgi:diguanylate cyclase (GGDEF)-like protein